MEKLQFKKIINVGTSCCRPANLIKTHSLEAATERRNEFRLPAHSFWINRIKGLDNYPCLSPKEMETFSQALK